MRSIKVTTVKKIAKGLKNKQERPVKKKVLVLEKKQKGKVLKSKATEVTKACPARKNIGNKIIKRNITTVNKKENAEKKSVKVKCANKIIKKDESVKRQRSPAKQDDMKRNKSPVKNEEAVKRLKSPSKNEEPVKGTKSPGKVEDKLSRKTEQEKGVVKVNKRAKGVVKTKSKIQPATKLNSNKVVPDDILKNSKLIKSGRTIKATPRKNVISGNKVGKLDKLEKVDKHEKAKLEKLEKTKDSKMSELKIKTEPLEGTEGSAKSTETNKSNANKKGKAKPAPKPKASLATRRRQAQIKKDKSRNNKLYSMWTGPKKHRVASLNASAKVHCLYENESRANILDTFSIKKEPIDSPPDSPSIVIKSEAESPPPTRILRCVPGLRAFGKMWDMHDTTSSDSEPEFWFTPVKPEPKTTDKETKKKNQNKTKKNTNTKAKNLPEADKSKKNESEEKTKSTVTKEVNSNKNKPANKSKQDSVSKIKSDEKKPIKRRKRAEIIMDLKDMVVRKRMASLNATAILAASYSVEKRGVRSVSSESDSDTSFTDSDVSYETNLVYPPKKKCFDETIVKKEDERKLIEVRAAPNKKVAVIVNQDTDVTITGVYLNSTTRSTHHEGFCSIAGMQYRISATSHTQTAATAVATETILQSSSTSQESCGSVSPPTKSYTPLDALSNMQPPAGSGASSHHHLQPSHVSHGEKSPVPRRHGCSSAFSAPPGQCGPPSHHHPLPGEPGYIQGYYQPAGPLISVSHGHSQPPLGKSVPLSEPSPSVTPPVQPPPAPSSTGGDSSDSEVIITSVTSAKEAQQLRQTPPPSHQYRFNHYPPAHSSYPYGYPPHYYPAPPPAPAYSHHDICYPPYSQHKYMYRRYLPPPPIGPQYYPPGSPEVYGQPHTQNSASQQVRRESASPPPTTRYRRFCEQVVTSTSTTSGGSYPQAPAGPPPPTLIDTYPPPPPSALVETYPPPPPAHYYPSYGPAPPPSCYTHSSQARPLNYINATYQGCPCPMQSCSKNVHTGPLTGDSKRSNISLVKDSMPLPPVALALPLEPASATGPPSPARGSAGMPPPPSPAGATYQPPPPKQEVPEPIETDTPEKRRKARLGKAMVRNSIAANHNTMLLMCHARPEITYLETVKREVESPKDVEVTEQKTEEIISKPPVVVIEDSMDAKEIEPLIEKETLQCLKVEEAEKPLIEKRVEPEILPCIKTVAENVKVKNMKRNLSVGKDTTTEESSPAKKCKSSYKNLIKRMQTQVKMNNGKRKLISESRFARITLRRPLKRKLALSKSRENFLKRQKASKPLTVRNLHNLKHTTKDLKENVFVEGEVENKEPVKKKIINGKKNGCLLESVGTKNQETPISSATNERTPKVLPELPVRTEKCVKGEKKIEECKRTLGRRRCKGKISVRSLRGRHKLCEVAPVVTKVPRRSVHLRWSNGWAWEGEPYEGKVFINSDETIVTRTCYPAMRHEEGDKIEPRDCVLLKAGQRKNELPFVAKIAALWENPDDGEMMMSLLWYYRPEHTEQGRVLSDQQDEVFASRHKDSNSVACIEDKCYVLTFNEYCRHRKNLRRLEDGVEENGTCIPDPEPYPRTHRQPPTSIATSPDLVFFCRRVYDFRQKRIVKNPS